MRSLGKYIVKIFALVEGSNKNSAILFSNKTYSKLATSYPIGIREAFQFLMEEIPSRCFAWIILLTAAAICFRVLGWLSLSNCRSNFLLKTTFTTSPFFLLHGLYWPIRFYGQPALV